MGNSIGSTMIGIDVGASKIEAALVTLSGIVHAVRREATQPVNGADGVISQITGLANELINLASSTSDASIKTLLGIGIGIPGQVNTKTGLVRQAVNLGWNEVDLIPKLKRGLKHAVPIAIDTDANASTLGEFYFGAGRGCGDFVFICIGSGLGAGIIVNGSLVSGTSWKAAELGHISLDVEGLPCKCGLRGCAETIVSGPGLIHLMRVHSGKQKYPNQLSPTSTLTPAQVIASARSGDGLALTAFAEMGRCLGFVISICAAVTNPSLIIIGGGLGLACFDLLLPPAEAEIHKRILPSLYSHMEIVPSQLESSAIGAACLVLNQRQNVRAN